MRGTRLSIEVETVLPPDLRTRLARAYEAPPRHHHTFGHAAAVAERVADLGGERATVLAAWFLDAVHDPRRGDNEEASAALMEQWLPDDPDVGEAARLVRAAIDHDPDPGDEQAEILSDADLAFLAGDAASYAAYRAAIRAEWSHLDEAAWRRGRAGVVHGLLAHSRLFRTEVGVTRWERAARANLERELQALRAQGLVLEL